ncbi:MAG: hypothetical protein K0Q79_1422 [Flavipsychrobacter sp.]|jgi:hypothetical protein|nr:hypothetical protein [Flavipsychrobacter sp.]
MMVFNNLMASFFHTTDVKQLHKERVNIPLDKIGADIG